MRINSISSVNFGQKSKVQSNRSNVNYLKNTGVDTVSFGATRINDVYRKANVDMDTAMFVANSLSTSTSGHRAPYMSKYFTPDIVKLITLGVAGYAKENAQKTAHEKPMVMIGGDTRKATRESLPLIKDTLNKQGVNVLNIEEPVPTPLLALASKKYNTDLSVLMTASHNPWADGGYNLVTDAGAIAPASVTKQVAKYMTDIAQKGTYSEQLDPKGETKNVDLYRMYVDELQKSGLIDFDKIKDSGLVVYYDGLQGTGNYVMPKLMKEFDIPFVEVKSSGQEGPNPTDANLGLLKDTISRATKSEDAKLRIGLANDGDADRFGVVDEKGKFINANDVILLVGYHLAKNKGLKGDIVRSQATSMQLDKLAEMYGGKAIVTPVGFKYIAEDILDLRKDGKDILVAGEESGGLTVNGHIPEKDGIIATALIADLVATEGRPVSEILKDVKKSLGVSFAINNFSKKFTDDAVKEDVMKKVYKTWFDTVHYQDRDNDFDETHKVDRNATLIADSDMRQYKENGDGHKFVLTDGSTVLIRKSGTEPLIKCYIEATGKDDDDAKTNSEVLKARAEELLNA